MNKPKIKVMVIDDHQVIIDGLQAILEDEDSVEFAGGANNMDDGLELLSQKNADVVLVDISMPEHSGIEVTHKIKSNYPDIKVLALTMYEEISMITAMIEAGASGYLFKRTNMSEVIEAINVLASGKKYLGREVQEIMMDSFVNKESRNIIPDDVPAVLTEREMEILNLIAREYTSEEIANKLFISERTVETHRRNIFTKTKTKSIVGLIKYAIRFGLISYTDADNTKIAKP